MKKVFLFFILMSGLFFVTKNTFAMQNPWIECKDDISLCTKHAGFNLPLRVENYNVYAMKGLLEFRFPLDKKRNVILRKAETSNQTEDENGIIDISGVYTVYPVNKTIKLKNGVPFNVKGKKNKFYVANFAAESGYYSFYCQKGMTLKDINYFYKILEEAEANRRNYDEIEGYSIEKLTDLKRVNGIVEPVYTQDCFPRTLQKKGVSEDCFTRANLGYDSVCSTSEVKMIKDYYKKGQDKDPLNDGSGQFCAR